MTILFDSFAKASAYFGGVISPQRLGQLAGRATATHSGGRQWSWWAATAGGVSRGHSGPPGAGAANSSSTTALAGASPTTRAYSSSTSGSIRELSSCRSSWISSAPSGRRKGKQQLAARRLVSRDVEALQQTITQLEDKAAKVSGLEELRSQDASKMETQRGDLEDLQKRLITARQSTPRDDRRPFACRRDRRAHVGLLLSVRHKGPPPVVPPVGVRWTTTR